MTFGLHFGMMVHLDPIEVKFEGQGHRSKTTQVEKCSLFGYDFWKCVR